MHGSCVCVCVCRRWPPLWLLTAAYRSCSSGLKLTHSCTAATRGSVYTHTHTHTHTHTDTHTQTHTHTHTLGKQGSPWEMGGCLRSSEQFARGSQKRFKHNHMCYLYPAAAQHTKSMA